MATRKIIVANLFCGAGGTSTGLLQAAQMLDLDVELLAVNHWEIAIATHSANHPGAIHLCENLDNVNPRKVVPGGRLDLLIASPECIHHSRARGGRPINDQSRASAWHVLRWADALDIRNILIENVPEFRDWGPLDDAGRVINPKKGKIYLAFLNAWRALGYNVSARIINAADYGDPTTRKRLFILARKGKRISWPEPTHSKVVEDLFGVRNRWRVAREIIDWSLKGESIFSRKRPLSPNTIKRIEAGLRKYGGAAVDQPLPTVAGAGAISLIEPFIVMLNGTEKDQIERSHRSVDEPMPTVTTNPHLYLCKPFIVPYYGTGVPRSVDEPLGTQGTRDRFGLVEPMFLKGSDGQIYMMDIRFRMLQPHELALAMSFPDSYQFKGNREQRVKQIGNAVPVRTAEALCMALLG